MVKTINPVQSNSTVLAIFLMLSAVLVFAMIDGISQHLAGQYPAFQVVWMRYGFGLIILLPFIFTKGVGKTIATPAWKLQLVRAFFVFLSGSAFIIGQKYLALPVATAISFASPFFITLLSIPLLKEKVGIRRWTAVTTGFVGVLLIFPISGVQLVDLSVLYSLLLAASWAMAMVVTRKMGDRQHPLTTLAYTTGGGFLITSFLVPFFWETPDLSGLLFMAAIGLLYTIAQFLVIRAFTLVSASVIAPFSYSQLIWAIIIGMIFFDSFLDIRGWVGVVIIIGSGIYVWYRERVLHRRSLAIAAHS